MPTFLRRDREQPIEAMQYTTETAEAVAEWCGGALHHGDIGTEIRTARSTLFPFDGAWVIRREKGFDVEYEDRFNAVYEMVDDAAGLKPAAGTDTPPGVITILDGSGR